MGVPTIYSDEAIALTVTGNSYPPPLATQTIVIPPTSEDHERRLFVPAMLDQKQDVALLQQLVLAGAVRLSLYIVI